MKERDQREFNSSVASALVLSQRGKSLTKTKADIHGLIERYAVNYRTQKTELRTALKAELDVCRKFAEGCAVKDPAIVVTKLVQMSPENPEKTVFCNFNMDLPGWRKYFLPNFIPGVVNKIDSNCFIKEITFDRKIVSYNTFLSGLEKFIDEYLKPQNPEEIGLTLNFEEVAYLINTYPEDIETLGTLFTWSKTSQGYDFWKDLLFRFKTPEVFRRNVIEFICDVYQKDISNFKLEVKPTIESILATKTIKFDFAEGVGNNF